MLAFLLWCSDSHEEDVGEIGRFRIRGREAQSAAADAALENIGKIWFEERDLTRFKLGDLGRIDVHTEDFVPEIGHTCRVRGTEIAGSQDSHLHVSSPPAQPSRSLSK